MIKFMTNLMTNRSIRVLLIEDNPGDARLVREALNYAESRGIELVHAEKLAEGAALLVRSDFDAILLDLSLPDSQGLNTLRSLRRGADTCQSSSSLGWPTSAWPSTRWPKVPRTT